MIARKNLLRIIIISVVVLIIYGGLQQLQPKNIILKAKPSIFIENGLFAPIASIAMLLTFIIIGIFYLRINTAIYKNKVFSGFIYSLSFIGFWFVGMFEPYLIYNESIKFCLFLGIVDSIALLLLGIGFGIFVILKDQHNVRSKLPFKITPFIIIPIIFILGRLIGYLLIGIKSSIHEMFFENLIWLMLIGISTSLLYEVAIPSKRITPIKKSIWFGISFFGPIWLIYNSFNPLFVTHDLLGIGNTSLLDLYIKVILDILFISFGVYLTEIITDKNKT